MFYTFTFILSKSNSQTKTGTVCYPIYSDVTYFWGQLNP